MTENKCISRICLVGFDENIIKAVEDEEHEVNKESRDNSEIKE